MWSWRFEQCTLLVFRRVLSLLRECWLFKSLCGLDVSNSILYSTRLQERLVFTFYVNVQYMTYMSTNCVIVVELVLWSVMYVQSAHCRVVHICTESLLYMSRPIVWTAVECTCMLCTDCTFLCYESAYHGTTVDNQSDSVYVDHVQNRLLYQAWNAYWRPQRPCPRLPWSWPCCCLKISCRR